MRIDNLTEEKNATVAPKRTTQQHKLYKNYNNFSNCCSNSSKTQQQSQHDAEHHHQQQQTQQQQQNTNQKPRTFPKTKYSYCNNNKNKYMSSNNNNNNNSNNSTQFVDGNCINGLSKNTKRTTSIYENNYVHKYSSTNNCSASSCSSSKNSSPSLSLTDENVLDTIASISRQDHLHKTPVYHHYQQQQHQQHQQQQKQHCNINACSISRPNLYSTSVHSTASLKMIDNPVTPTVYSATWSARNNTNIYTTATVVHNFNDDNNNNNDHKTFCQALPLNATSLISKASTPATLLSPISLQHCQTISTHQDSLQRQLKEQLKQQQNSYALLSNAKVSSSIEINSSKHQQQQQQTNSSPSLSVSIAVSLSGTSSEIEQNQQTSSPYYDYSNSYPSLPRTQSKTARTKSSSNPTTATPSSSSLPFPQGNNSSNNNTIATNKEHGSKGGGGGGKHHFNRKKFWKVSGNTKTECPTAIATSNKTSTGLEGLQTNSSNSEHSVANGIQSCAGTVTDNICSNIVNNTSSPKSNSRAKNSNNRNHKNQPQQQFPELSKKTTTMSPTATTTITNSAAISVNTALTVPPAMDNKAVEDITTSTTTTASTNLSGKTLTTPVMPKVRSKLEEKIVPNISTTTEKLHTEERAELTSQIPQQILATPVSPSKKRLSPVVVDGSVNQNYPSGMPSYTLDFLHSVGKRMLAFGTGFPSDACDRIVPSTNSSNYTQSQMQQSGHRSNRFVSHSNSTGYNHGNQHHHHHPQPQQLTIASFLQKDMFPTTGNARGATNTNTSNNSNTATSTNTNMSTENSPHTYGNQVQYPQHRLHTFYNHPTSMSHYYRHQGGIYPAFNGQSGIVSTTPNNSHRYHNSHNSNGNANGGEHAQRQQPLRNQQQRQQMVQQPFIVAPNTPNRKHKGLQQQSKSPSSLQNASSPSSSTSSLSSLTSTASSHIGGNVMRQSNGTNKANVKQNSAGEMPPPNSNSYPTGSNAGSFRHNNHGRHHSGNSFNHHPVPNVSNNVMGQHQNFNNLTYVVTNGYDPVNGTSGQNQLCSNNSHGMNVMSSSESSSRACSPSVLSSSDNVSPEPSQALLRAGHPDQQAVGTNQKDYGTCVGDKHHKEMEKTDSDTESSSSQQSEEERFHRHNMSYSSHKNNTLMPNPIEFPFNPMQFPPNSMHFPPHAYRNGMMPPNNAGNLPNNFHEDEIHLHGALQQQFPNLFFTTNGHGNSSSGPPNNNVVFSQSPRPLIAKCPSTGANISRFNEDETLLLSSRSSSSGSDHNKGSTPESDIVIEMRDQIGGMNRINPGMVNTLPSSRSRGARLQQHPHALPPPFLQYPFNQQSMFCSNYLAYLRSTPSNTSSDLNSNIPPDRFMSRSHLVEVKETPSTLLNNSKYDSLSQQVWDKFIEAQQTEETFKLKMRLWRYLYVTIKQTYPRYGLYLVGSTMSGFGADSADVDMCLVSRSFAFVEQRMEALFNLTILRECLRKSEDFENFNLIEAKVPILRFRDRSNHFEVDLNFNNSVGIKNTHLLYCYTQLDWRLRPLALIVKLWAQYHDINNAKNMTISSYSLVLMVIHFLQFGASPAVLPCLHKMFPDKFTPLRSNEFGHVDMNDNVGPYESKNTQPLGELFLNFLEYYSSFDYRQNAISIRTGGLLPVNICRQAKSMKNDIHQWKELCIEEPFDLTNTARSVYDFDTFERIKAVFSTSFQVLKKTLELNSIFAPLVLPRLPISARIYMKRTIPPNAPIFSKNNKDSFDDHPQKHHIPNKRNEKSADNDQKSNAIHPTCACDDEARAQEKSAGCGDVAPANATAL